VVVVVDIDIAGIGNVDVEFEMDTALMPMKTIRSLCAQMASRAPSPELQRQHENGKAALDANEEDNSRMIVVEKMESLHDTWQNHH